MRAALLSTLVVILCLAGYAHYRRERVERARETASAAVSSAPPRSDAAPAREAPAPVPAESEAAGGPTYETATSAPAPVARHYVVRDGDSLASLARRYYGDEARAQQIYEANRDRIRDPERLHAGQELVIP